MINIRKALAWSLMIVGLTICSIGCTSKNTNIQDTDTDNKQESALMESGEEYVEKIENNDDSTASLAEVLENAEEIDVPTQWQDNTRDPYKGAFLHVFDQVEPEGLTGGGYYYKCANATGVAFGKFFFEEYKNNREALYITDNSTDVKEIELIPENYGLRGLY